MTYRIDASSNFIPDLSTVHVYRNFQDSESKCLEKHKSVFHFLLIDKISNTIDRNTDIFQVDNVFSLRF